MTTEQMRKLANMLGKGHYSMSTAIEVIEQAADRIDRQAASIEHARKLARYCLRSVKEVK